MRAGPGVGGPSGAILGSSGGAPRGAAGRAAALALGALGEEAAGNLAAALLEGERGGVNAGGGDDDWTPADEGAGADTGKKAGRCVLSALLHEVAGCSAVCQGPQVDKPGCMHRLCRPRVAWLDTITSWRAMVARVRPHMNCKKAS